jgi:molybdopterin-guanine dinucleotide biosynthesis protein A
VHDTASAGCTDRAARQWYPAWFAPFGLPVLNDGALAGQGPLAVVLTGLGWAAAQGCMTRLTVPGDTPFIPAELVDRLAPAPACAASAGHAYHLVALSPVTARSALHAWPAQPGPRRVRDFAAPLSQQQIDFAAVAFDPFLNVNTPEDLTRARALADRVGTGGEP